MKTINLKNGLKSAFEDMANLSALNNLDSPEVTEDFSDSPFADRVEPDTNDPSQFPAEGSDLLN